MGCKSSGLNLHADDLESTVLMFCMCYKGIGRPNSRKNCGDVTAFTLLFYGICSTVIYASGYELKLRVITEYML
jgi:hypothetical protein